MPSPPPRLRRPLTVADVARAANVSKATAARALGGYGAVSEDARELVLAAARRLDYRPNELARTMATGRSGTLGVIVGDIENPYFGLAVRGISDTARQHGFNVILANSGDQVEEEEAAFRVLMARQVDGLIVAPALIGCSGHLDFALDSGKPLVLIDRELPGLAADVAVMDDRAAAKAATELMLAAGHRHIGYISASRGADTRFSGLEEIPLSTVRERIAGFLQACSEAGVPQPEAGIRLGFADEDSATAILHNLLAAPERPTAILASDDLIALRLLRGLKRFGVSVPGDMSLITFHDADWTSAMTPAVTVIAQPAYELGVTAATMLLERIGGEAAPARRRVLPTRLVERESVAPPP